MNNKKSNCITEVLFLIFFILGFFEETNALHFISLLISPMFIIKILFKNKLYKENYLIKNKCFKSNNKITDFIMFYILCDIEKEVDKNIKK